MLHLSLNRQILIGLVVAAIVPLAVFGVVTVSDTGKRFNQQAEEA
ncbi:hypothetical protein LCGC14_3128540, partial [marine sediment metagenome]